MAKTSAIEKDKRRRKMVQRYAEKRQALKQAIANKEAAPEERFQAALELAKLPRNSSKVRVRNRCQLSGRSRGVYRKFKLSRIALRELGSMGMIPGLVKSSW